MSDRFEQTWAVATGLLCVLVMLGLAFTGPLALIGVVVVIALSVALRWLVRLVMRHRTISGQRGGQAGSSGRQAPDDRVSR